MESVFLIRKTKKNCFLKGKHETKKCFQINKENQENKNCCFSGDPRWCVCVLSGQVWLHAQIVKKQLCRACFQSDLRWAAGGYPPASAVG